MPKQTRDEVDAILSDHVKEPTEEWEQGFRSELQRIRIRSSNSSNLITPARVVNVNPTPTLDEENALLLQSLALDNHEALFPAGTGEVVDSTTATTTSVTWGATGATGAATDSAAVECNKPVLPQFHSPAGHNIGAKFFAHCNRKGWEITLVNGIRKKYIEDRIDKFFEPPEGLLTE